MRRARRDPDLRWPLVGRASSNIVLQAKHDILFATRSPTATSGVSLTAQAGNDITVNAPLSMAGDITLKANDAASGAASGVGAR
jgi:hypothetical protein